jgi:hypothetical protein
MSFAEIVLQCSILRCAGLNSLEVTSLPRQRTRQHRRSASARHRLGWISTRISRSRRYNPMAGALDGGLCTMMFRDKGVMKRRRIFGYSRRIWGRLPPRMPGVRNMADITGDLSHYWTNFGLPARDRRCSCCNFWHCFAREYFPFCAKEERTSRTLRPDRACEQRANVSGSGPKPNYMCTTRPTTVRTCSKREANSYDSTVFKLACTCTLSHTKSISAHHNPQAILTINI